VVNIDTDTGLQDYRPGVLFEGELKQGSKEIEKEREREGWGGNSARSVTATR